MNRNDPRANRTRRAILDSAIESLLNNPRASMSDIASRTGIGRSTLYRHFETREKLVFALAAESLKATDAVLAPIRAKNLSARETLCKGLHAIMPLADRFHFLVSLWNICGDGDEKVMAVYNRQLGQLAELIERGKKEKSIDKSLPTAWIVLLIDSLIYVGWWSISTGDHTPGQAAEMTVRSLFRGIGTT